MEKFIFIAIFAALFSGHVFADQIVSGKNPCETMIMTAKETGIMIPVQTVTRSDAERLALEAKNAYWLGKYDRAIEIYHLLLRSSHGDYNDIYNLACCYSKIGKEKSAARYLCLSVEEGFDDYAHIMGDPDFEKIRETPCFQKALKRAGQQISRRMEERNRTSVKMADISAPK